jgi:hypothetical protein
MDILLQHAITKERTGAGASSPTMCRRDTVVLVQRAPATRGPDANGPRYDKVREARAMSYFAAARPSSKPESMKLRAL